MISPGDTASVLKAPLISAPRRRFTGVPSSAFPRATAVPPASSARLGVPARRPPSLAAAPPPIAHSPQRSRPTA